jgi:hypothetical protein
LLRLAIQACGVRDRHDSACLDPADRPRSPEATLFECALLVMRHSCCRRGRETQRPAGV